MTHDERIGSSTRTNEELLNDILNSEMSNGEKAVHELGIRQQVLSARLNKLLVVLTIVATLSTFVQALPVMLSLVQDSPTPGCQQIPLVTGPR